MPTTSIGPKARGLLRDAYVGSVLLAGAALFVTSAAHPGPEPWNVWGVLGLLALMIVAERLSVRLPHGELVSVATIPHMVAILLLPTWLAMALAGAAMIVDQLAARAWLSKVLFNIGSILLTVYATAAIAAVVGLEPAKLGRADQWQQVPAFLLVAATYYLVTHLLLGVILGFAGAGTTFSMFVENIRITLPAEFAVCGIGGLATVLWVTSPNWAPLLVFPVVISQVALWYVSASRRSQARLAFLAEASRLLALSLDEAELALSVARVAVPTLADAFLMYLRREDGSLRLAALNHCDQRHQTQWGHVGKDSPTVEAVGQWVARMLRNRRSTLSANEANERFNAFGPNPNEWQLLTRLGVRSIIGVPVATSDRILGAMVCLASVSGRRYGQADLALAEDLAHRCAISLDNGRLYREAQAAELESGRLYREARAAEEDLRQLNESLERRVRDRTLDLVSTVEQLKGLSEVSRTITSNLDLSQVLSAIVARAVQFAGADDATVFEYYAPSQTLVYRASYGLSRAAALDIEKEPSRHLSGAGLVSYVARSHETLRISDVALLDAPTAQDLDSVSDLERCEYDGIRAVLVMPMLLGDALAGVLCVRRRTPGEFPPEIVDLLETFAAQSTVSIHNARLFQELQLERASLEVASRHKSDFLAKMSHELRTPLNAIIGFSEVLLDRSVVDVSEEQRLTFLSHIHRGGQHLLGLINDILDISKVEAGHMELYPELVSLSEVIDACAANMHVMAAQKQISLTVRCEPPGAIVDLDPVRLKQVVYNLLSNAVKFTPEGGRVRVDARVSQFDVVIAVRDNGVGIKPEDQRLIFDEFRQADAGAKRQSQGTGLGLALVRRLVDLHGGSISLESTPGEGSCFTVTLPTVQVTATAFERPTSSPAAGLSK